MRNTRVSHLRLKMAALLAASVLGCREAVDQASPTTLPVEPPAVGTAARVPLPDFPFLPSFDIDVSLLGALAPGRDVNVEVRFHSLLDVLSARLQIYDPEYVGPAVEGRRAIGQRVAPQWETDRGFRPNERSIVVRPIRFSRAGLYRLFVKSQVLRVPVASRGLQTITYRELWIRVGANGGAVLSESDLQSVRVDSEQERAAGVPNNQTAAVQGCDTWVVQWQNDETGVIESIGGMVARGVVRELQSGNAISSWQTDVDASGHTTICNPDALTYYTGEVFLENSDFSVAPAAGTTGAFITGYGTGGSQTQVGQAGGRVWKNLQAIVPSSRSLLGVSRSIIGIVPQNCNGNGFMCYVTDYIKVPSGHELGREAYFALAHEYGHAVHNTVLGGLQGNSCETHAKQVPSFLACALKEGFADFHAAIVTSPTLITDPVTGQENWWSSDWGLESRHAWPGCTTNTNPCTGSPTTDGSIIEDAVAAFLYDLWDGPNTLDSQTNTASGGDDDAVEYPASYIASILNTCRVDGSTKPNGIDHLIYCFEQGISSTITSNPAYFPTRGADPSSFSESATEPGGWSQSAIRERWQTNLYGGPPPPPLTVSISGKSSIKPNVQCTWTASTTGTAPFSYYWSINGVGVSNGSPTPSELIYQNTGSSFTIGLVVGDAATGTGSATKSITVSAGGQNCTF